jgi:coproporphyrinogen III oxidase-like Fe-S oxidoreductase
MQQKELPIGYWIKKADELLSKGINNIQSSFAINRIEWQVLNSISDNELINKNDITDLMKPFANLKEIETILTKFKAENLIIEEAAGLRLTHQGIEFHKNCLEQQKIFRQKATANISKQDYQITVLTLQKIVGNLSD